MKVSERILCMLLGIPIDEKSPKRLSVSTYTDYKGKVVGIQVSAKGIPTKYLNIDTQVITELCRRDDVDLDRIIYYNRIILMMLDIPITERIPQLLDVRTIDDESTGEPYGLDIRIGEYQHYLSRPLIFAILLGTEQYGTTDGAKLAYGYDRPNQ